MAFFMVAAVADGVVCQKITDQEGNCLLPCLCCHIAGAILANPIVHDEYATPYVQALITSAPVLLVSTLFHPPRA